MTVGAHTKAFNAKTLAYVAYAVILVIWTMHVERETGDMRERDVGQSKFSERCAEVRKVRKN